MSGQSDQWLQFYQQNQVAPPGPHHRTMVGGSGNRVSDATVVTTTVTTSATTPSQLGSGNSSPGSGGGGGHLSPEGRVSKPIRRRSRASRRTPTTLLNTDTTNFRAMVQQFTGGPSAPFGSGGTNVPNFNFGLGSGRQAVHVNPTAMMMGPSSTVGYHHLQPHQQHLYQHPNQQPQQYMFSLNSSNTPGPGDHAFLQRLGSTRPTNMGLLGAVSDHGFVMDGDPSSSQVVPPAAARPSSNPTNENRSNNFLF